MLEVHRSIQREGYYSLSTLATPTPAYQPVAGQYAPSSSLSAPFTPSIPSTYSALAPTPRCQSVPLRPSRPSRPRRLSPPSPPASSKSATLPPAPLSSTRPSSGAWTPTDDLTLMAARAQGMNWAPIQQAYFPSKTPNACRKRHERLMEKHSADDWDGLKLENLAKNYMGMRREIWSGLAAQVGEKWNVVEQKCMSQGLKNLQHAARSCARRERMLDNTTNKSREHHHTDDSGIGLDVEYEDDGARECSDSQAQRAGVEYTDSGYGNRPTGFDYGSQCYYQEMVSKVPSMDMGIKAILNRGGSRNPEIKVAAENPSHEAGEIQSLSDPEPLRPSRTDSQGLEQKRSSEYGSPTLEESLNTDETVFPAIETPPPKTAPRPSSAFSVEADDTKSTDPRELSDISQEHGCSTEGSSRDSDAETQNDYNCQETATDVTRQYTALLTWTSVLRRSLLHRLMQEFYKRLCEEHIRSAAPGDSSTGRASTSDSPTSTSEAVSSEPRSATRLNTSPASQKRPADNEPDDEQDDKRNRKRQRKDPPKPDGAMIGRRKLPCPFRRHDPKCFGNYGVEVCGRSWPDIAKLKEHLYRKHYTEFQCQRCKTKLHSRIELDRHAESPTACHPRPRHPTDGFTFETWLTLHNKKKSFQGQSEEDRWREIYIILFPSADTIPEPAGELESAYVMDPSSLTGNMSLEEFGDIALPQEFKRRAAAIVNNTMRPLEMELFDQVPSILQASQETVTATYQQLLNTSSSEFTMMEDLFVPPSSSGVGNSLPLPGVQNTIESSTNNLMDGQWTLTDALGFDPFIDLWTSPNTNHRPANGDNSPDSGFNGSLSCSCIGVCICKAVTDRQPRTPQFIQPGETLFQTKDSKDIFSVLQSMNGRLSAIEKNMQVPELLK